MTKKLNCKTQNYRGIPLQLINRSYKDMKAKRYTLNNTNQNIWIPNKHLHPDGTIIEGENINYCFRGCKRKFELAGLEWPTWV